MAAKIKTIWHRFTLGGKVSLAIIIGIAAMWMLSPMVARHSHRIPSGPVLEAPSAVHWLGTDDLGIDLWAQLCHGAGASLQIGIGTALLAGVGGSLLGVLAGYHGGKLDQLIMGICDMMMVVPQLPSMIVLGAFFGAGRSNMIMIIAIFAWAAPARIVRSKIRSMKHDKYIVAASSYGAGFFHLLKTHFLPGILPLVVVNLMRIFSHAIVAEAGLAFIGLGDPIAKSWGMILNRSLNFPGIYFTAYWKWWVVAPVAFLISLMLALAMVGRDLERVVNRKR
ncbi:ABC transporter permease [Anoxynatronum buryatiense]|uniref:Peptide/nickel transport system permease protein n=1 Tax=Anoxynatronum buryatiense TaxID=489973 RepID=A0AA45WX43_9CLOT|nr:ABC transporter permease [Anoxynatronum buryatiense]SMP62767.1 peptide/nickel transport system permease protein [Anoxynatronum buryatiense]